MRRDQALNHDIHDVPEWLPQGFEFAGVAEAETVYKGADVAAATGLGSDPRRNTRPPGAAQNRLVLRAPF